jgi:hypothetical protein
MRWTHCMEKNNGYPRAEPRGAEAYLRQYVEATKGEPACWQPRTDACQLVAAAYRRLQQKRS